MKAIVFDNKSGPHLDENYPDPSPGPGEVLIAVETIGVCKTDLEILKGYMGFEGVIGHEFVGTVIDGPDEWMSKRVVAEINCNCGTCEFCLAGLGNHCPTRSVIGIVGRDGVMAEQAVAPLANLHHLPDSLTSDRAVFVEPLLPKRRQGLRVGLAIVAREYELADLRLHREPAQQRFEIRSAAKRRHERHSIVVERGKDGIGP